MDDPVATLGQLSNDLRLPFDDAAAARVKAYLEAKPQGKHGRYVYESVDPEQMSEERRRFRAYQDYFKVPNES
jgi:hypothetical protein